MINPKFNKDNSAKTAIITETGKVVTYSDLSNDVREISQFLINRDIIFIICNNDYVPLQFYLAALETGAVPLLLSSDTSPLQLNKLIELYSPHLVLALSAIILKKWGLSPLSEHDKYTLYRNHTSSSLELHKDLAFLATTSGSTGDPKLVRFSANNLKSNASSIIEYLNITPNDRAITSLPMNYSYGLSVINSHLLAGASIVLSNHSLMEREFWQQINTYNVTSFAGVPYHFEMLLRLGLKRLKIPTIKKITQAGGKLTPEKTEKVHAFCEEKGINFWVMYGQTEASPRMSYLPPHETLKRSASIGIAIPNGKMWICDERGEAVTDAYQTGELVYEGPNVCMGHAWLAEDLALNDRQHGILKTGDLAHFDEDGFFYIDGRLSRFLKIYGNRIALDQVEQMIHAYGLIGIASGEDDKITVHIVNLDSDKIATSLQERLATAMKINPQAITIQIIDSIPRLANGKIDYQCLR